MRYRIVYKVESCVWFGHWYENKVALEAIVSAFNKELGPGAARILCNVV